MIIYINVATGFDPPHYVAFETWTSGSSHPKLIK